MSLQSVLSSTAFDSHVKLETRPKKIKAWLDALPLETPFECCERICAQVTALNESISVVHTTRLELLELYRGMIGKLLPALEHTVSCSPLPLVEKNRQWMNMARKLMTGLAPGYRTLLTGYEAMSWSSPHADIVPLLMQRLMGTLLTTLSVSYKSYRPPPQGLWLELHQLFDHARKLQFDEKPVAASLVNRICSLYKQGLLLTVADPSTLKGDDVNKVVAYLASRGELAELRRSEATQNHCSPFVVNLNSDTGPVALAKQSIPIQAERAFLLDTRNLITALRGDIVQLESGVSGQALNLSEAITGLDQNLLRRLAKTFGGQEKRRFERIGKNARVSICNSFRATHYLVERSQSGREHDSMQGTNPKSAVATTGSAATSIFECALAFGRTYDESPGGLAVRLSPECKLRIHVGDIAGVRLAQSPAWNIGVVRRMTCDGRLEVGLQILADGSAPSIAIRLGFAGQGKKSVPALLLPEIPLPQQPPSILAPPGVYRVGREFTVDRSGAVNKIRATRLLEQTEDFELFQFVE